MRLKDQNEAEYCLGPVSIRNSSDKYFYDNNIMQRSSQSEWWHLSKLVILAN